jgi:neutral ceramidase
MRRLLLVLLLGAATAASAQELRAGTAEADITPPPGAPLAGYYTNREATGTHDPLHAKALVLEQGGTKIVIVACDLVGIPRQTIDEARSLLKQQLGLAPDHIMISATHTHTAPVVLTNPSHYNLTGEPKRIAEQYTKDLPAKIAEAVVKANAALVPVQMHAAVGEEKTLGFNRRFFMKDGTVGWNPGKLNPKIERPAGPVDTSVPVLYFDSAADQKPLAAYVNFSVHLDTTQTDQFSADYPYTLDRVLKFAKGDPFFSLFTIGASGNVNHFDVAKKDPQGSYQEAARIGAVLAGEVLKVIQEAPVVSNTAIRLSDRFVRIPVPTYTAAEVAEATRIQATFGTPQAAPFLELVKAARILELSSRRGKPLDIEVQVFTLGDRVAIVGFPGELFAELGLTIKEDSPFPVTIIAELADGEDSYIPNRIAYTEGNYEPIASRMPVGAGETLMDSALEQLVSLVRESADDK